MPIARSLKTCNIWGIGPCDKTEHFRVAFYCGQFLPISINFAQSFKRRGLTFQRPQSATWSTLCEGDVRQMVVTPILTGFLTPPQPPNKAKMHISERPFIVASLRHTCEVGWIISAKKKCSLTDFDRFVNNIWEKWNFCVYKKKFLDLWFQPMKNGSKIKCCVYIFVQCI